MLIGLITGISTYETVH